MARSRTLALGAAASLCAAGCGGSSLPDPRAAARDFAEAVARGDAARVHELLSAEPRRALGQGGVERALSDGQAEIGAIARSAAGPAAVVGATAEVRYVDGEVAVLVLEPEGFRVSAAAGMPSQPRTPEAALADLRGALARRSYPALLRVLASGTRSAMDDDLRSLVEGLTDPDALGIRVRGDLAEVDVPGGHKVLLKREAGVWRVHDFD